MSSQTHRDRVKEARKKRREYLWGMTTAATGMLLGGLISLLFGFLVLEILSWFFSNLTVVAKLISFLVASLFAVITYLGVRTCYSGMKKERALPYVPPVREQIANLPAEEVLLRGSDQPTATPEELLRAAQAGKGEQAAELLRADAEPVKQQIGEVTT